MMGYSLYPCEQCGGRRSLNYFLEVDGTKSARIDCVYCGSQGPALQIGPDDFTGDATEQALIYLDETSRRNKQ